MSLDKQTRALALKNAIDYGEAVVGKVLPKLFQFGLKKENLKIELPKIKKIVDEVNKLSPKEREKEFAPLASLIPEKEEKDKDLPDLKLEGKVVTRLAPEPSKYLHLGHAISFLLNYMYAKKYEGKCLLRFEDTNPEKVTKEYADSILDDLENYLKIKPDSVKFVSDDMDLLIEYAEQLIEMDKAYMCFCDRESMRENRQNGKECSCRKNSVEKNKEEWENFKKGKYPNGETILRIKADMKSKNHVMRDSVIFRFIDKPHYKHKDKYKVWPMYDFYNAIEDSIMGITLVLRSNEFDQRVELQDYIKDLLNLPKQKVVQYGRFNVADFTTKGREIRELIESGEYIGWDDPRLITLKALKRRGITKEAFYELTKQSGLSKKEVNLQFDMIASINRKLIDDDTNRYFFIENPVEIKVENMPDTKSVEIPLHPGKKETKKVKIDKIFIAKEDFEELKGKEIRLLHLYNIQLDKKEHKATFTSVENKNIPRIQWVSDHIETKVFMPDGKFIEGYAESATKDLKKDEVIQFERFGFVKLDKKSPQVFWFSHK